MVGDRRVIWRVNGLLIWHLQDRHCIIQYGVLYNMEQYVAIWSWLQTNNFKISNLNTAHDMLHNKRCTIITFQHRLRWRPRAWYVFRPRRSWNAHWARSRHLGLAMSFLCGYFTSVCYYILKWWSIKCVTLLYLMLMLLFLLVFWCISYVV